MLFISKDILWLTGVSFYILWRVNMNIGIG